MGTFPPEESWGRGAMEQAAGELRCRTMGSGATEAVPGMLRWPPVCGLLAFLLFSSPLVLSTSCIQQQNGAHPLLSLMTIH